MSEMRRRLGQTGAYALLAAAFVLAASVLVANEPTSDEAALSGSSAPPSTAEAPIFAAPDAGQ